NRRSPLSCAFVCLAIWSHWLIIVSQLISIMLFFFNDTATTEIYTLSLHDALPIFGGMKTYNWEVVNPDGYFLDKLEPIPSGLTQIGRAVQQECRDRSRMPSSA